MKKIILYSIGVFLLSTVLITIWYVMHVGSSTPEISFTSVKNVAVEIGFYGAFMATILFLIGHFAIKTIKNKWLLGISLLVLLGLIVLAIGWFLWYVSITGLVDNPIIE